MLFQQTLSWLFTKAGTFLSIENKSEISIEQLLKKIEANNESINLLQQKLYSVDAKVGVLDSWVTHLKKVSFFSGISSATGALGLTFNPWIIGAGVVTSLIVSGAGMYVYNMSTDLSAIKVMLDDYVRNTFPTVIQANVQHLLEHTAESNKEQLKTLAEQYKTLLTNMEQSEYKINEIRSQVSHYIAQEELANGNLGTYSTPRLNITIQPHEFRGQRVTTFHDLLDDIRAGHHLR